MRGKLLFLVGLAAGYVLGSRAGRERYEQIKRATNRLWNDPRVQRQVKQAEDFAKDKAPEVADFLAEGAKKIVGQVSGRPASAKTRQTKRPAAAKQPAASSTDAAK